MHRSLKQLGEFGLISRLKKIVSPQKLPKHWQGIGDDTSVIQLKPKQYLLLTHDLLLEKIHFLPGNTQQWQDIGWKALAVNLSDIAAMGGEPLEAVVGLGIPATAKLAEIKAMYRGLEACARRYACPILGGDTNRSADGWTIAVSVLGQCVRPPMLRSGAQPDDSLWVSGTLGDAALAWSLWQQGRKLAPALPLQKRLQRPEPRLEWSKRLAATGMLSAMLDVSDGLAGDLAHLAESSRVGFELDLDRIPRSKAFQSKWRSSGSSELALLLSGGEDYELLFTVQADVGARFANWVKKNRLPLTHIGFATQDRKTRYASQGWKLDMPIQGFTHW